MKQLKVFKNFARRIAHGLYSGLSFSKQGGQSLLEVIIALAIFSLVGAAMVSLVIGGFTGLEQGGEHTQAEALTQEGIEAVRSIRDSAWNEVAYDQSKVEISGNEWIFSGEGTTEDIGQYTRIITIDDVCRDGFDEITSCPGAYTDVHSKKVIVSVSWRVRPGITNSVQRIAYLTNWDSKEWIEDTLADFNDGTFNDTAVSVMLGDGDGAVTLEPQ